MVVLYSPTKIQVRYFAAWDGKPINVGGIRGAHNTTVSRLVKVVKGGVAHTDVEPIGWPGEVGGLTCGAQVQLVLLVILHLLQHPELLG